MWFLAVVAVLAVVLLSLAVVERPETRASMAYGAFLDQVEARNVVSVTMDGTEIHGRLKPPSDASAAKAAGQGETFTSRAPDFGDPALIPALRRQHVAIDVATPSAWTWLLARVPWPMLIVVGIALIAGSVRFMHGSKTPPEPGALPAHGMLGLVSKLFASRRPSVEDRPPRDADEPEDR